MNIARYRHASGSFALGRAPVVNVSRVDLNLFVVLDAIYTEGGITRASERMNLTQPAISHALARLRELVGDLLFVREGHTMMPTAAAHALIGPVRRALKEIEGSLNQMQQFDPATSTRSFRIGMRHMVESATLPELALRVRAQAPGVRIAAVHHDRDALHGALATGELDAAINVLLPRESHVSYERLAGGRMVVAVRADHPRVRDTLDLATYLALDHVMTSSRRSGPGLEDGALQRLGHERRVVVRCQQPLDGLPARRQFRAAADHARALRRHCRCSAGQPAAGLPGRRGRERPVPLLACKCRRRTRQPLAARSDARRPR